MSTRIVAFSALLNAVFTSPLDDGPPHAASPAAAETIYLPAAEAGQLSLGDEARIIVDPLPQYVVPATISFVATDAQFTPKSVETAEERQKLMFRVKLQGDPKVLDKYHRQVKTGVRGLGFVRTDPKIAWPEELVVKLPQ